MAYFIGIDLGGTNIMAGIVDSEKNLLTKAGLPTPTDATGEELALIMRQAADMALKQVNIDMTEIDSIGVGSPGIVDTQTDSIIFASNLKLKNEPLGQKISQAFDNKPVRLVNDANAAAYGEYIAGTGKDASSLVMITLGTGIGGGIIIDGHIVTGFAYGGAELGHLVIDMEGRACACGRRGCFENYGSARGLILTTQAYMRNHPETIMWELCNQSLNNVSGQTAFDAKRAGDAGGEAVVADYIHHLAVGLGNIINSVEPEVLCLGGGVSNQGDYLIDPLREAVYSQLFPFVEKRPKVMTATLGNDAGIIGAALSEVWNYA